MGEADIDDSAVDAQIMWLEPGSAISFTPVCAIMDAGMTEQGLERNMGSDLAGNLVTWRNLLREP